MTALAQPTAARESLFRALETILQKPRATAVVRLDAARRGLDPHIIRAALDEMKLLGRVKSFKGFDGITRWVMVKAAEEKAATTK